MKEIRFPTIKKYNKQEQATIRKWTRRLYKKFYPRFIPGGCVLQNGVRSVSLCYQQVFDAICDEAILDHSYDSIKEWNEVLEAEYKFLKQILY